MKPTLNRKTKAYEVPVKLTWYDLNLISAVLSKEFINSQDAQIRELVNKMKENYIELDTYIRKRPA